MTVDRILSMMRPNNNRMMIHCNLKLYEDILLSSSAGVQQGNNLGPFLFSLVFYPLLLRLDVLKRIPLNPLDLTLAYLDDLVVTGNEHSVKQAFDIIQTMCPGLGLNSNVAKCELIPTNASTSTIDLSVFSSEIKRNLSGELRIWASHVDLNGFAIHTLKENVLRKLRISRFKRNPNIL